MPATVACWTVFKMPSATSFRSLTVKMFFATPDSSQILQSAAGHERRER